MGKVKFTLSKRRRRWKCKTCKKLTIKHPDKNTVSNAKEKSLEVRNDISKLNNNEKKEILISKGVIRHDSKAPTELLNTMLNNLL